MRYRLPDALGGGEWERVDPAGPAMYLMGRRAVGLRQGDLFIVIRRKDVTEIEMAEPPLRSVVLDRHGRAWQHMNCSRGDWTCTVDDLGANWAELNDEHGPLASIAVGMPS